MAAEDKPGDNRWDGPMSAPVHLRVARQLAQELNRGCAFGSGPKGRRFESSRPDRDYPLENDNLGEFVALVLARGTNSPCPLVDASRETDCLGEPGDLQDMQVHSMCLPSQTPTLAQVVRLYLQRFAQRVELGEKKEQTLRSNRSYAKRLHAEVPGVGRLADLPIKGIGAAEVAAWLQWLGAPKPEGHGYARRTVRTCRSFLKLALDYGARSGWTPPGWVNPCRFQEQIVVEPRQVSVTRRTLREWLDVVHAVEQERSLYWRNGRRSLLCRAPFVLFRLILITGARPSEIRTAKWVEVDLDDKVIRRPTSKTGDARVIPLSELAVYVLAQWRQLLATRADTRAIKPVFPSVRDPNKPIGDYRRAWARVRSGYSDPALVPYDLRRSAARHALEAGASACDVAAMLGNTIDVIERCYAPHVQRPGAHRAADAAADRYRKNGATPSRLGGAA